MARYIRNEMIQKPKEFVDFIIADFLNKSGFKLVTVKGETMFQNGSGWVSMPKYFSYRYENGVIHIEAWVRYAWLPGIYGKESGLEGAVGSLPKNAYKKDLEELIRTLYQPLPSDYQNTYGQMLVQNGYGQPGVSGQPMQNAYGQTTMPGVSAQPAQNGYGQPGAYGQPPMPGTPITVRGVDMGKNAKTGMILVLIGIPLMFLYFFGAWMAVIFAIMGTAYCYRAIGSSKNGTATTGFVLGLLVIIGGIALITLNLMDRWAFLIDRI